MTNYFMNKKYLRSVFHTSFKINILKIPVNQRELGFRNSFRNLIYVLTQTGSSPRQTTLSALQADHPAFEMSRRPGGCRHLGAHVGVRVGVGTSDRTHQSASVLVSASSVSENQRALVGCISPGVGAHGRAVRIGESM